jgi:hypothetical protein
VKDQANGNRSCQAQDGRLKTVTRCHIATSGNAVTRKGFDNWAKIRYTHK